MNTTLKPGDRVIWRRRGWSDVECTVDKIGRVYVHVVFRQALGGGHSRVVWRHATPESLTLVVPTDGGAA